MRLAHFILLTLSIAFLCTSEPLYRVKRDAYGNNSKIMESVHERAGDHNEATTDKTDLDMTTINIVKKESNVPDNLLPEKDSDAPPDEIKTHATIVEQKTIARNKPRINNDYLLTSRNMLDEDFIDEYERKSDFGPVLNQISDVDMDDLEEPVAPVTRTKHHGNVQENDHDNAHGNVHANVPEKSLSQNTEKIIQLAHALIEHSNFMENRPDQTNRYKNKNLFLFDETPKVSVNRHHPQKHVEQPLVKPKKLKNYEQTPVINELPAVPVIEPVEEEEKTLQANQTYREPMASLIKFANMLLNKVGITKQRKEETPKPERSVVTHNTNTDYLQEPNNDKYQLDKDDYLKSDKKARNVPLAAEPLAAVSLKSHTVGRRGTRAISKPQKKISLARLKKYILAKRHIKESAKNLQYRCPAHREVRTPNQFYDEDNTDEPEMECHGPECSCRYTKSTARG